MPDKKEPRWDAARAAWVIDTDEGPVLADPQPPPPVMQLHRVPHMTIRMTMDGPIEVPPAAKLTL